MMNSDTLQWRAYCSRVVVKHKLEDTVYNNSMKSIYGTLLTTFKMSLSTGNSSQECAWGWWPLYFKTVNPSSAT